jgi:hypothetical protein
MSERKHAVMQRNEMPASNSILDQPNADSLRNQLASSHDAVLALSQRTNRDGRFICGRNAYPMRCIGNAFRPGVGSGEFGSGR